MPLTSWHLDILASRAVLGPEAAGCDGHVQARRSTCCGADGISEAAARQEGGRAEGPGMEGRHRGIAGAVKTHQAGKAFRRWCRVPRFLEEKEGQASHMLSPASVLPPLQALRARLRSMSSFFPDADASRVSLSCPSSLSGATPGALGRHGDLGFLFRTSSEEKPGGPSCIPWTEQAPLACAAPAPVLSPWPADKGFGPSWASLRRRVGSVLSPPLREPEHFAVVTVSPAEGGRWGGQSPGHRSGCLALPTSPPPPTHPPARPHCPQLSRSPAPSSHAHAPIVSHRMWLALDLSLLRNVGSVHFAKSY